MKFNKKKYRVFGDEKKRGKTPPEAIEQVTFFNYIRATYPDTIGLIAVHNRNEGKRTIQQTMRHKAEGMTSGSSDILIPANPPFVCELKRENHMLSHWQNGQEDYLEACAKMGAFACVALGHKSAIEALEQWRKEYGIE